MTPLLPGDAALPSGEALLAWWQVAGRRDPAQKPWMFFTAGRFPESGEALDPYGVFVAEVMLQPDNTVAGSSSRLAHAREAELLPSAAGASGQLWWPAAVVVGCALAAIRAILRAEVFR